MRYYPVNLDIKGRKCLVVGGGAVGTRKVGTLLACGAQTTVVSPVVSEKVADLAKQRRIVLLQRAYQPADQDSMFLVIGATADEALNRQVAADAEKGNRLCNIADRPKSCNFILPAIVNRGDLVIAVSTSGQSPAFAKKLRRDLSRQFGPEYSDFLGLMGAVRQKLLAQAHAPEAHKPLFEALIDGGLVDLIREADIAAIDLLLKNILGSGFRYSEMIRGALPNTPETD